MQCVIFCFICFTIGFLMGGNSMMNYYSENGIKTSMEFKKVDKVIME